MRRIVITTSVLVVGGLIVLLVLTRVGFRTAVAIVEAEQTSPTTLMLIVDSCNESPEAVSVRESAEDVRVEVVASVVPLGGGDDCLDPVHIELQDPLGDRTLVDENRGSEVSVIRRDLDAEEAS